MANPHIFTRCIHVSGKDLIFATYINIMKYSFLFALLFSFGLASGQSATDSSVGYSLIIQMESQEAWNKLIRQMQPQKAGVTWRSMGDNFHLYELFTTKGNCDEWKHRLSNHPGVRHIERVREAQLRNTEPNDELFSEQWALPLMGVPQVWNELQGAHTAMGDEIVVAVLDNGFLIDHPDLENQLWTNPHEIPNNGIDDDNNGYVDDVHGWEFFNGGPEHNPGSHGTPVAGIVGASTNNIEGIAGVAYNTKLMPLTASTNRIPTPSIYEALNYALDQRKRYNASQGQDGSFVVAVNISLGIDFVFPEDHPIWCDLLDSLGQAGVIPVVSTTNSSSDIESVGDIPALCGTDAQITVTKTTRQDEKDSFEGGFSSNFVHLGAPGQSIESTTSDGTYGTFSGTSASAPFVSGAIALLYSSPCEEFAERALSEPHAAALQVKELLLTSSKPLASLEAITISGGRLDVFEAMKQAPVSLCQRDSSSILQLGPQIKINTVYPNPNIGSVQVMFTPISLDPVEIRLFDMVGRMVWEDQLSIQVFEKQDLAFDLPNKLSRGVYILELKQKGSKDQTKIIYTP
jgi:hypothetical protein